MNYMIQVLMCI